MAGVQGEIENCRPVIALSLRKPQPVLHVVMLCLSAFPYMADPATVGHDDLNLLQPCPQPTSQLIKCFRGTNGLPSRTVTQVCGC